MISVEFEHPIMPKLERLGTSLSLLAVAWFTCHDSHHVLRIYPLYNAILSRTFSPCSTKYRQSAGGGRFQSLVARCQIRLGRVFRTPCASLSACTGPGETAGTTSDHRSSFDTLPVKLCLPRPSISLLSPDRSCLHCRKLPSALEPLSTCDDANIVLASRFAAYPSAMASLRHSSDAEYT